MSNYVLRIPYSTTIGGLSLPHEAKVRVAVSAPYDVNTVVTDMTLNTRIGGTTPLEEAVSDYVTAYGAMFTSETAFGTVELWHYPSGLGANGVWIQSISRADTTNGYPTAGTSAGTVVAASQVTLSLRATDGSVMKLIALETSLPGGPPLLEADFSTAESTWTAGALAATQGIVNKRGAYPAEVIRSSRGQNEATFRARYR